MASSSSSSSNRPMDGGGGAVKGDPRDPAQSGVKSAPSGAAPAASAPVSLSTILHRSGGAGISSGGGALSQAPSVERAPGQHHLTTSASLPYQSQHNKTQFQQPHQHHNQQHPTANMGHGASCLTGESQIFFSLSLTFATISGLSDGQISCEI